MHRDFFFLDAADGGQRFCIHHRPEGTPRAALIYIHPFAEEMNKTRRMAALQCRAFASTGFEVLQIDLAGCGDSSGDFSSASWQGWLDDIALAHTWLRARAVRTTLWLWGLRAGCLLAAEMAQKIPDVAGQLWWQPPTSGKALAQQWLRLKVAGAMMDGEAKGTLDAMKQQLAAGLALDIAGYTCSADLIHGLEQARLQPPAPGQPLAWLEVSRTQDQPSLMPVSSTTVNAWQGQGLAVHAEAVSGPAFWQTTEIESAPQLIECSTAWLNRNSP
jgi:uncharacterized protein